MPAAPGRPGGVHGSRTGSSALPGSLRLLRPRRGSLHLPVADIISGWDLARRGEGQLRVSGRGRFRSRLPRCTSSRALPVQTPGPLLYSSSAVSHPGHFLCTSHVLWFSPSHSSTVSHPGHFLCRPQVFWYSPSPTPSVTDSIPPRYNHMTSLPVSALAGLTRLRLLFLHGNEITEIPDGAMRDLGALQVGDDLGDAFRSQ